MIPPIRLISSWAILLVALLVSCRKPSSAPRQDLSERLDVTLSRLASTGATFAARVIDLADGSEIYSRRADEPVIPASNLKLLVSAAALDRFGPDYTLKTHLAFDGKDLYVVGTGDPSPGDARIASWTNSSQTAILDQFADALAARGITHISGRLFYCDAALDEQWTHPSWHRSFLVDWYAAPVTGLNFNDNCIDVSIAPTAENQPVAFTVFPPTSTVRITNNCVTSKNHKPAIERQIDQPAFTLVGTCAKPDKVESKPIVNPGLFFADILRTHLSGRGIAISGAIERVPTPPPPSTIISTWSTPLPLVLARINKNSQNLFAEAVCKLLGQQHDADNGKLVPGSWASGATAVHSFLRKNGIDDSSLVIVDGSGLSRENRVTARMLTDVLRLMGDHPQAQTFRDSLSICGVDGSLAKRMSGLNGRVLGKTGYIGGVCTLSAYIQTRSGKMLACTILFNNTPGDDDPFHPLQDEACAILADL